MTRRLAALVLPRLEPLAVLTGVLFVAVGLAAVDWRAGLIFAGLALVGSTIDLPRRRA